ncbi:baseplate J/gp47 family protein [Sporosarcina newyorkensis]|uniref:baseplate J/gp47 family protein n=1 Tax=Sporosarcina newyorkensis TaxID=759851 RepID=UPI003D00B286
MDDYGLTKKGFKRKQYADLIEDMEMKSRELFGENINLSERTFLGLFIRLCAWFLAIVWMLAEKVYNSMSPDTAEGINLDKTSKFIGTTRQKAVASRYAVKFEADPGIPIQEGFTVQTEGDILYRTLTYAVADDDGWAYTEIEALEAGVSGNVSLTAIHQITNPVAGVFNVEVLKQIVVGRDAEDDESFRQRNGLSATRGGASNVDAVRSNLLDAAGVVDAFVFENDEIIEVDGLPPKCIAPFVHGGEDDVIARTIFIAKTGGIQSYGTTVVDVVDSNGNTHPIGYTRPSTVDIYVDVKLTTNDRFPLNGFDFVRESVVKYIGDGNKHPGLGIGKSVGYTKLIAAIHETNGIDDIDLKLGLSADEQFIVGNVSIDFDKIASTSADKVVVT